MRISPKKLSLKRTEILLRRVNANACVKMFFARVLHKMRRKMHARVHTLYISIPRE